jgi:hypothetical protein
MNVQRKLLLLLCVLPLITDYSKAQDAIAISSDPGIDLHIALIWEPVPNAVKYNIYRRNAGDITYQTTPINAIPVQAVTDCGGLRSLLINGVDSTDWNLLAQGLSENNIMFNPCDLSAVPVLSERYRRKKALAKSSLPIAIASGWGYRDNSVTDGEEYSYRIVALNAANIFIGTAADNLGVTAGTFAMLSAPANIDAEAGDDAVLVTWKNVLGAVGYILERAASPSGEFHRVNESTYAVLIKNKLNGDTIVPAATGMIDYQRYGEFLGKDTVHEVEGRDISGPSNGKSYYYRVRAIDLFKRPGNISGITGPATPIDSTPPSVPLEILTTSDNTTGHVTVRWTQVVRNIDGYWERPDSSVRYRVFRFTNSGNPETTPSTYLGEVATIKGLRSRDTIDTDPGLRSVYGNRTWWYRIRAVDNAQNHSQWSVASSAVVKDISPPDLVRNLTTEGHEDHISLRWSPNTEPDISSYLIYRSLCHLGSWIECQPPGKRDSACIEWLAYGASLNNNSEEETDLMKHELNDSLPCPCSGTFVFLGEITGDSIERAIGTGSYFYEDHTIPAGSPLCYAYWAKAKDSSENVSGAFPIPTEDEQNEIACDRLRDRTPPEKAIISGLFAHPDQIRVEWIGPPTQDTRAYHVYRALGTDPATEPVIGEYTWVGGMTVELPPVLPQVLTHPYQPTTITSCDNVSVQSTPWMSEGYFEDKTVKPKLTYWYRVVGIDYDGNETPLDSAMAISTFTFSNKTPDPPQLDTPTIDADNCGVNLTWSPEYNSSEHIGFIVYRSYEADGQYVPIVISPMKGNSYTDKNVVSGQVYWYRIAVLMSNGRLSPLSTRQSISP